MARHAQANGDVRAPGHADVLVGMGENEKQVNADESRPKAAIRIPIKKPDFL